LVVLYLWKIKNILQFIHEEQNRQKFDYNYLPLVNFS